MDPRKVLPEKIPTGTKTGFNQRFTFF